MKKVIAIVLLLSVLSVCGFIQVDNIVTEEKSKVTITENVLYGDKSYAQGVSVFTRAHYGYHLFWDTTYKIGEAPDCSTKYSFYANEQHNERARSYNGVMLDLDIKYGVNTATPVEELSGISKAYRELYDATEPGNESKRMIRLQDYYTYYPIRVAIDLPGVLWQGNDYDHLNKYDYADEMRVWEEFNEFFKIPIPEDLPGFEISVTKSESGNAMGVGTGAISNEFYLNGYNVYTENRCFFSIGNRLYSNIGDGIKYVDTSLIPGGYGIYSFTFRNVRNDTNTNGNITTWYPNHDTGIDEGSLEMVYPLDKEAKVEYMTLSPDETMLILLTEEYDDTYFTVIDVASMTELQRFKVSVDRYYNVNEHENFIALDGDENISVIELTEDGRYHLRFIVPKRTDIYTNGLHKGISTKMDFDGERLVVIDPIYERQYGGFETCHFSMAVYTKDGIQYYAEYESSLSVNVDTSRYAYNTLPLEFKVEWE